MIRRYLAVGLVVCGSYVMAGAVTAQSQTLVLEDFQAKGCRRISIELGA